MRLKRWLIALGLVLVVGGALLAMAGSATALSWVLARAGITATGAAGNLWSGLRIARLHSQRPALNWQATDIELQGLHWQGGAVVSSLRLKSLALQSPPSTQAPPTPQALLRSLQWPMGLRLSSVQADELNLNGMVLQGLKGSAQAGGTPQALAVTIDSLRFPLAALQLQGSLTLTPQGVLSLSARAQRADAKLPVDIQLKGQGNLQLLPLSLALQGPHGATGQFQAELQPLQTQALQSLKGTFKALDLQLIYPPAPVTAWEGSVTVQRADGAGPPLAVALTATNDRALRLDQGGWPLRALQFKARLDPTQWQALAVQQLSAELGTQAQGAGTLSLALDASGTSLPQAGKAVKLPLLLRQIDLRDLNRSWPALRLNGELTLEQARFESTEPLRLVADVDARALDAGALLTAWRLQAQGTLLGRRFEVSDATMTQANGPGRAQLKGHWQGQDIGWQAQTDLAVQSWPLAIDPWAQGTVVSGRAEAQLGWSDGRWTGALKAELLDGNQLGALPLTGTAQWQAQAAGTRWSLDLQAPDATHPASLSLQGNGARALRDLAALANADAWRPSQAQWRLPQVQRLKAWWQPWVASLSGDTQGEAQLGPDGWPQQLQLSTTKLQVQVKSTDSALSLAELQVKLNDRTGSFSLQELKAAGWRLSKAQGQGDLSAGWRWQAEGEAPPATKADKATAWRFEGSSAPPLRSGELWQWPQLQASLGPTDTQALRWVRMQGANFTAGAQQAALTGGTLELLGEPLTLRQSRLDWPRGWADRALQLDLEGRVRPARWLGHLDPVNAWAGDLQTDLQVSLQQHGAQAPAVKFQLRRVDGDLSQGRTPLGLQGIDLDFQRSSAGAALAQLQLRSEVLGNAELNARTQDGGAGLTGRLQAQIGALHLLRPWLPSGLELRGQASLDAALSGSLSQPRFRGQGQAQIERLQHAASGLGGRNGELQVQFDEQRLTLSKLQLQGLGDKDDGGWLRGDGELAWNADALTTRVALKAEAFRLLNRFDRQLVTSGDITLTANPKQLRVRGQISADQGVFDISQGDAPTLDDDVSVRREPVPSNAAAHTKRNAMQPDIELSFKLGERLRVQGRGLASRLQGQLQFVQKNGGSLQTTGVVEMGGGRYKAYGQTLDIETGELRFTGSLDNPRIDILALRPDIETRVGVRATGSAQTPRVRLYSEPDLPDNEKLAWLLLGRAPDELGRNDTALLQRAAFALLSGEGSNPATQLMDKLGLTEFSVNNSDDAGTTLRVGAQLGRRWTVGYERSLNSATGSWQLVYRLGQRFRLRAQSGTDSALDALWLWRFDKL